MEVYILDDFLLLVVYNRLPLEEEIEKGIAVGERMIDSTIIVDDDKYDEFINSELSGRLDVQVTAIHRVTEEGYIVGI